MTRRSNRRSRSATNNSDNVAQEQQPQPAAGGGGTGRSVASHVRDRQRAVAEREASRLARPERRVVSKLKHADPKRSAVTSTPFGVHRGSQNNKDSDTSNNNNNNEWCGPFSVARQLIAKREEAKRKREEELLDNPEDSHPLDDLVKQVEMENQRKAHPSMSWKSTLPKDSSLSSSSSSSSNIYSKRQKRADMWSRHTKKKIPSLFQLCVDFVVQNFEYVESLGDVDNDVRVAISKELVSRNQFTSDALTTLVEPYMETLEIIDCAGIPQAVMTKTIETTFSGTNSPHGDEVRYLRYLILNNAGRCFGPTTVQALLRSKIQLRCLSISGAYLLTDIDAAKLIETMSSTLCSIEFKTCPLLGDAFVTAIKEHCIQDKKSNNSDKVNTSIYDSDCLLELSLRELELDTNALSKLASAKEALCNLQSLKLRNMKALTDDILLQFLESCTSAQSSSLETLDVSDNLDLTDTFLSGIREYHSNTLRSLSMNGLKQITAAGLEALFTYGLDGLHPPPKLKVLQLGSCDSEAVTDQVMELVVRMNSSSNAEMKDDNNIDTSTSFALRYKDAYNSSGGLVKLDIQGSTCVTDTTLEELATASSSSSCKNSLQELNVSYCPNISDKGLGYLVSQMGKQLSKIQIWGCAQITDYFLDGHCRAQDPSLEIVGAWMKKSGTRTVR